MDINIYYIVTFTMYVTQEGFGGSMVFLKCTFFKVSNMVYADEIQLESVYLQCVLGTLHLNIIIKY